jgi:hypothetical protein
MKTKPYWQGHITANLEDIGCVYANRIQLLHIGSKNTHIFFVGVLFLPQILFVGW